MSMEKFTEDVVKKAMTDKAFKEKLLKNPKAALKDAFGKTFPDDFKINVVMVDDQKTFVIPIPSDELSDSALDSAAGGSLCYCYADCDSLHLW